MTNHQRLAREISRREAKITELHSEIKRTERFLGDRRSYLTSLKEAIVNECDEIRKNRTLQSSIDDRHVSLFAKCYT